MTRIRRFNEQQDRVEISSDRVEEIVAELKSSVTRLGRARDQAISLSNELSNFRSSSRTANNQIDDSSINLDLAASKLEETSGILDGVVKSLEDYSEKGPRYLYG